MQRQAHLRPQFRKWPMQNFDLPIRRKNRKIFYQRGVGIQNYLLGRRYHLLQGFDDLKTVTRVILTHDEKFSLDGYVIAKSPEDALRILSAKGHERALVSGGPTINSAFLKANLIDEIIFNIEPVAVGKGLPVFAAESFQKELELISTEKLPAGIIQVRYKVKKS